MRAAAILLRLLSLCGLPTSACAVKQIGTAVEMLRALLSDPPRVSVSPSEPLHIVGAGLPRTGTSSLRSALNYLGYRTYHMVSILEDGGTDAQKWADVGTGRSPPEDIFRFLGESGYNATLDYPSSDFFEDAMRLYPNAKVILSVRDNPRLWAKSWSIIMRTTSQLWESPASLLYPNPIHLLAPTKVVPMRELRCSFGVRSMGLEPCELKFAPETKPEGWLEDYYERHYAYVTSRVPPERLLVFNVKQGWEPLCKFLGKPVPDIPFPRVNDSSMMKRIGGAWLMIVYGWIPLLLTILRVIWRIVRRCIFPKRKAKEKEKAL